jgi:hypothetical protein
MSGVKVGYPNDVRFSPLLDVAAKADHLQFFNPRPEGRGYCNKK